MMNDKEKISLLNKQTSDALEMYASHIKTHDKYDELVPTISNDFINVLCFDSVHGEKAALRDFLRLHPDYNEEIDGISIDGEKDYSPNFQKIKRILNEILTPVFQKYVIQNEYEKLDTIQKAASYFFKQDNEKYINALSQIAPNAYKEGRKMSRILRDFCKVLGVVDETKGSEWNKNFALIADEFSTKLKFKINYVIHPAAFLTMSNPYSDERGETMVSCHSLNSNHTYKTGATGYARDGVTIIAYVAAKENDDARYTRKIYRQLFFYKPYGGVLIQSRLYKTQADMGDSYGGTKGKQAESKFLREGLEKIIADIEGKPNLWKVYDYIDNKKGIEIEAHENFGGYCDWQIEDFSPMLAIRNDMEDDCKGFIVGEAGFCWHCGEEIGTDDDEYDEYGVLCSDCKHEYDDEEQCADCGEWYRRTELHTVYDRYGDEREVCSSCRSGYYTECEICGNYYEDGSLHTVYDNGYEESVCSDCFDSHFEECEICGEHHRDYDMQDGLCPNCYEQYHDDDEEKEDEETA